MNNHGPMPLMSAEADRQLDELLDQWASSVRLSPQQENRIYSELVAASGSLSYEWWRALFDRLPLYRRQTLNGLPKRGTPWGNIT